MHYVEDEAHRLCAQDRLANEGTDSDEEEDLRGCAEHEGEADERLGVLGLTYLVTDNGTDGEVAGENTGETEDEPGNVRRCEGRTSDGQMRIEGEGGDRDGDNHEPGVG